jgi:hypothetical protein
MAKTAPPPRPAASPSDFRWWWALVNAILNDPSPLSIHDEEMQERLSACLVLLLESGMKPSAAGRRKT